MPWRAAPPLLVESCFSRRAFAKPRSEKERCFPLRLFADALGKVNRTRREAGPSAERQTAQNCPFRPTAENSSQLRTQLRPCSVALHCVPQRTVADQQNAFFGQTSPN